MSIKKHNGKEPKETYPQLLIRLDWSLIVAIGSFRPLARFGDLDVGQRIVLEATRNHPHPGQ